jgi:hypothetical protein
MEDVLDLDTEPHEPEPPSLVSNEGPLQHVAETRTLLPTKPGGPRRFDYEYRHNSPCNLFTTVEPLAGWRHIAAIERRTAIGVAH